VAMLLRAKGIFMTARGGYLRFAPNWWTREEEVETAVRTLHEVLAG
jgi:hypothetical protein